MCAATSGLTRQSGCCSRNRRAGTYKGSCYPIYLSITHMYIYIMCTYILQTPQANCDKRRPSGSYSRSRTEGVCIYQSVYLSITQICIHIMSISMYVCLYIATSVDQAAVLLAVRGKVYIHIYLLIKLSITHICIIVLCVCIYLYVYAYVYSGRLQPSGSCSHSPREGMYTYPSIYLSVKAVCVCVCSAEGSTHTESNKLHRKVKHRYRPNLSPRQRPTAKSRHGQAALAASAETRGATHRARPRSPSRFTLTQRHR